MALCFPLKSVREFIKIEGARFYQSIIRDITDRKLAEMALRDSERRLSLHIQQTPLAFIELDTNFQVIKWNPAAEKIFGYAVGEAIGQHAKFIVPEKFREYINRMWNDLLAQKGGNRSTSENITKDGRTIICEWYNTPLTNSEGKVIGVASHCRGRHRAQTEQKRRCVRVKKNIGVFLKTLSKESDYPKEIRSSMPIKRCLKSMVMII